MLRLPGGAASIMTGQELVNPRRHTHIASLVTQYRHTSRLGLSSMINFVWDLLACSGQLLAQNKTEDVDGLASHTSFTWEK